MRRMQRVLCILGVACVSLAYSINGYSATLAGQVQFAFGDAQIVAPTGVTRALKKGDTVNEGDTIITARMSSVQVKMKDGGYIAVRPDSHLKFEKFVFDGNQDGTEREFFSLLKGGFRAITGLIGKINKQNYKITTPVATLGIRGTDHETVYVPIGNALVAAGVYSKVNTGATSITTNAGTIVVMPNQMGYARSLNDLPIITPINTNIFTVSAAPNKTIKEAKQEAKQEASANSKVNDKTNDADPSTVRAAAADSQPVATNTTSATSTSGVEVGSATMPIVPVIPVILTDASNNVLNLTTQVVMSATGQSVTVSNATQQITSGNSLTQILQVQSAAVPNPYYAFALAIQDGQLFGVAYNFDTVPANLSPNATNPSFFVNYGGGCATCSTSASYVLNGVTIASTANANNFATTGIKFGRYSAIASMTTTYTYPNSPSSTFTQQFTAAQGSWIAGPGVNPSYLPEALVGTATYVLDGGTAPTTQAGVAGTINSAALSVNFTNQTVGVNLSVSAGGHSWVASGSNMPLVGASGPGNNARSAFYSSGTQPLTVTMDGVTAGSGNISGELTGNALNGALFQYYLSASTQSVSGVVAMLLNTFNGAAATSVDTATPYQLVAMSRYEPNGVSNSSGVVYYSLNGAFNNASRVARDANGNLAQFDMAPNNNGGNATTAASMNSQVIAIGTAVATDMGKDPISGISWGRWQGGNLTVTDRVTNAALATINNANSSLHWMTAPVMTGPVTLPVSGTFTYTLAGGTHPTDNQGNVGTLNSATLQANFTSMTVNAGVNVTVAGVNYVSSGSNLPIQQNIFSSMNGSGTYTATANGAKISGDIGGAFTGTGATGAGVVYGFQNGTVTVNGVAAFHR